MHNLTSPSHNIVQYYLPKELMSLVTLYLFKKNIYSLPITRKVKTCETGVCLEISLPLSEFITYFIIFTFNIFPTGLPSFFSLYIAT